ncbi:glycosyltransferase [Actinospica durhamensis]|uniref:Glycosyltransferase n=1 Tax=Actinospica durhamensis TaxID=1508375 RepID=A0A941IT48_9ACTN|nr:glycosyltransferase [Actinospica durhamensis]MBR7837192.1 glycosyltransferase [Actinospica durhamensis]
MMLQIAPDRIDTAVHEPDPGVGAHIPVTELLGHTSVPMYRTLDGVVIATALDRPERAIPGHWFPGERLVFQRTAAAAVQDLIAALRSEDLADEMANAFTRDNPAFAARTGIAGWQKAAGCALVLALGALLLTGGLPVIALIIGVLFCGAILIKVGLALAATGARPRVPAAELSDDELPTYTVLIPAYHEADVIGDTVRCVADLDYPKDKLEILVLVERRDEETISAIRAVDPPEHVRIVLLPPGLPQTKPRSCNLGLLLARGELLVIFDAEDRPERGQLRTVAGHFAATDERLACVQAKLNFYNARRNVLTRLFSVEYSFWFDAMLVGMDRLRLPIPLGGTSNHLRTDVLRRVGGWDAWNVTEDADLGIRLASAGYRVEIGDSTTWEECPDRPWNWIKQRTRWLKGYLLTLLVHTRQPVSALRRFGVVGMAFLLAVVGGTPAAFMLWPFALGLALSGDPAARAAAAAMGGSALILSAAMLVSAFRRRLPWPVSILVPCYWLLHAFAGWRGLVQLVRAPYTWEKTSHRQETRQETRQSARQTQWPQPAAEPEGARFDRTSETFTRT